MHAPDPALEREALDAGFVVGDYLVEPRLQRVTAHGKAVSMEPRVMEVLVRLAQQPGEPVSKEDLLEELWRGVVVTDDALLRCIGELRRVFGDDARAPRYIETIRKRGYRLVAPVAARPASTAVGPPAGATSGGRGGVPADEEPRRDRRGRRALGGAALGALAVGALALALWPAPTLPPEPPRPYRAIPLTSFPGIESDPRLSPDGGAVAFLWDGGDGGGTDLYVQQIGVGTARRLTETDAAEGAPAWSPDGQRVAFARGDGLFVVPVLGGAERRLVDLERRAIRGVAWAPDGETIVIAAETERGGPYGLFRVPLGTLQPVRLTTPPVEAVGDLHPSFSPDGDRLAFVRSITEGVDDVFVIDPSGGEPQRLTTDYAEITGLDWARDGRRVVVASDRGGGSTLWAVPVDGSAPTWVPTSGEGRGVQQPTLARQSGRLAFVQRDEETNLWALPLGPGAAGASSVVASTRWDSHPALSPDGQRLAFVSDRSGASEVWVAWADGVDPYPVTALDGAFVSTPRWSPDGRRIAFVATSEGSADVFVVDAAGGEPVRITTADANDRAPSWSRDGRTLYFASARSGRWEVWRRPSDGSGGPTQVTDGGGFAAQEAADGQSLYFTRSRVDGLWRRPLRGGPPERVLGALESSDWGNWAVTERGVFYVRRPGGSPELWFWDPTTREDTRVADLPRLPTHPALALASDGTHAVVTRIDRGGSDILLVEGFD